MAPSKRSAASVGPSASKKARVSSSDPVKAKYAIVAKALRGAKEILRPECAAMLEAVLPHCLQGMSPANAPPFHATQLATAALVASAFAEIEAPLIQKSSDAQQERQLLAEKHEEAVGAFEVAGVALATQLEKNKTCEAELEEATKALAGLETTLQEATGVLEAHQKQIVATEAEKMQAEKAIKEHLAALHTGAWSDGEAGEAEAKSHLDVLMPLCTNLELEESMLQALPVVAGRRVEDRGQFDIATLAEVEKRIVAHVEKLGSKLVEAAVPKVEFSAAVEKAQAAVAAAQEQQQARSASLEEANAQHQKLLEAQIEAQGTLNDYAAQLKKADAKVTSATKQLLSFREGPLASFENLRRVEAVPEVETVAPEPAMPQSELVDVAA